MISHKVLERSKMARDAHRAGQLGTVLLIAAQDNDGDYLQQAGESPAVSSLEIFQALLDDGYLSDRDVLASNRYESKNISGSLVPEQVGWSYVAGMTLLNSPGLPLLISRHAVEELADMRLDGVIIQSEKNPWEKKGLIVFYSAGNAETIRAREGGLVGAIASRDFPESAFLLHPDSGEAALDPGDSSGLTKNGTGEATLSGSNSYNGASSVTGGTLSVGSGGGFPGGSGTVGSGAATTSAGALSTGGR